MEGPYEVSYRALRRLAIKTAKIAAGKLPAYYPDVNEIDTIISIREFGEKQFREEALKYFVACMTYGFSRDNKWHDRYPKKRTLNADNILFYLFTPYDGEDAVVPHINIWDESVPMAERENRQAAFEYMQGIIMDPEIYLIKKGE